MTYKPTISVSVVTHNGGQKFKNFIQSLKDHPSGKPYNLVIVDSETTDDRDLAYLDQLRAEGYEIIRKSPSRFDTGGHITVWKQSNADYFLFLQDDCVIMEDDWLQRIYDQFREKIPIVYGMLALGEIRCNWSSDHVEFVERVTGMKADPDQPYPWGSVFFTSRAFLDAIDMGGFLDEKNHPTRKMECEAWEITWGHLCKIVGGKFDSIMGRIPGALHPEHYRKGAIIMHDITLRT